MLSFVPGDWGPQLHASFGSVAHIRVGPNAIEYTSKGHYASVMLAPHLERSITINGDKRRLQGTAAGALDLIPARTKLLAEWRFPIESIFIALCPERMSQLAIAEYGDKRVEFALPAAGHIDTHALKLAKLFESEFRSARKGSLNQIYLDSLLTVFSMHLLRRYTNAPRHVPKPKRGGLTAQNMQRVDDFIRANLARKFNIIELAAITGFSPTHFARAFRETTGRPPHQYVTLLRLRLVEKLTKDRSLTLGEIAIKAGFSTHSHMTATMQQYWGVTPSEHRRLLGR